LVVIAIERSGEAQRVGDEAGRQLAFERFSQGRLERAYRLASLLLRDPFEAEDAVHDAAIQAWLHWSDLRGPERMDAWFDRIVVNQCRARLRRRTVTPITIPESVEAHGADEIGALHDRDSLRGAYAALSVDHRVVVILRYVFDLTPAEIAARTGEREGTVKSRLHYALRQMRAVLDAAERQPGGAR
jgi:RNA polymerase sigma-70 factor, ECF subfamily